MHHVIEAATDVATVCCFDPIGLPIDFEQNARTDPRGCLQTLAQEGRLWYQNTGADGSYLFHIYIDENVPSEILERCSDPKTISRFLVPSGQLVACGAEYISGSPQRSSDPRGGPKKYSGEEETCTIPPGEYTFRAWRAEWPEEVFANRMVAALGEEDFNRRQRVGLFQGLVVCGLLLSGVVAVFATLSKTARGALGLTGLLVMWGGIILLLQIIPRLLGRMKSPGSRELEKQIEREMPNVVVQLERLR